MVWVVGSSWLLWGPPGSSGNISAPVGFTEPTCPIPLDFFSCQGSWTSQDPEKTGSCMRQKMLWEATSESILLSPECTFQKVLYSPKNCALPKKVMPCPKTSHAGFST